MRRRVVAVAVLACALGGCTTAAHTGSSEPPSPSPAATSPTPQPSPTPTAASTPAAEPSTLTIVAGGDILPHLSVNDLAWNGTTYDYASLFSEVTPWISGADLAICALEVPIVPPGEEPSNYPQFGAPPELITSMKEVGWDGCATATNHSMDRRFAGIVSTLDTLDAAGMGHAGTARTQEEADQIQYYTLNTGSRDVVVAHLSATTLTNGILIPKDHPYSWNVVGNLGQRSVDDLIADARRAREAGADIVVVSMHWGTEYVSDPIPEQTDIAAQLAASGAVDLVLGNHSHVPEPVTKLDGGPDGHGMWVVYSMGNLISGQTVANNGYRVVAGLLTTATVDVPSTGAPYVSNLEWTVVAQDDRTDHLFLLHDLMNGATGTGMTLSNAEIQARADVTYPVMEANGSTERTAPPVATSTLVSQDRR